MVYLCFCPEPTPQLFYQDIYVPTHLFFSQRGSRNSVSQAGSSNRDRCFTNPEKLDHLFQLLARTHTHTRRSVYLTHAVGTAYILYVIKRKREYCSSYTLYDSQGADCFLCTIQPIPSTVPDYTIQATSQPLPTFLHDQPIHPEPPATRWPKKAASDNATCQYSTAFSPCLPSYPRPNVCAYVCFKKT